MFTPAGPISCMVPATKTSFMKNILLALAAVSLAGFLAAFSLQPSANRPRKAAENPDFQTFIKQFPKAALPYAISKEFLQREIERGNKRPADQAGQGKHLDDPNRFLPGNNMDMMSRSPVFKEPVAQLATAEHVVLIYSATHGFSRQYRQYRAVTFSKNGNYVSAYDLAMSGSTQLIAAHIDQTLLASRQSYHITWEKDFWENGTENNRIASLQQDASWQINLLEPPKTDEYLKPAPQPVQKIAPIKAIGAVLNR